MRWSAACGYGHQPRPRGLLLLLLLLLLCLQQSPEEARGPGVACVVMTVSRTLVMLLKVLPQVGPGAAAVAELL